MAQSESCLRNFEERFQMSQVQLEGFAEYDDVVHVYCDTNRAYEREHALLEVGGSVRQPKRKNLPFVATPRRISLILR